jgi:hypothetical protein
VSDRHLRLLRAVAKRRREDVERDEDADHRSTTEEHDAERAAAVTNARLTASEARRRRPDDG